jgi:hypothetical protein
MAEVHEIGKARRGKCPNCGKQTIPDYRPFCSARCKTIDLGKWVTGSYRIPTDEVPEEGDLEALLRDREDER